ncbi:MAG TPA: hypothetical protein VGX91_00675 [Candidatus Cybelea sp.]|jgi:hypothetical protein|nr:hypothetical protein [Candidatus Cybelea sp.]
MADPADRPLAPEPVFRAALKALLDVPKSKLDEIEHGRVKRKKRAKKPAA